MIPDTQSTGNHWTVLGAILTFLAFLGGLILGSFSVATKFWKIIHRKIDKEDLTREIEKAETTRRECQTLHLGLLERVEQKVETQRKETNENITALHGKVDTTNNTLQQVLLIVKNNGEKPGAN